MFTKSIKTIKKSNGIISFIILQSISLWKSLVIKIWPFHDQNYLISEIDEIWVLNILWDGIMVYKGLYDDKDRKKYKDQ